VVLTLGLIARTALLPPLLPPQLLRPPLLPPLLLPPPLLPPVLPLRDHSCCLCAGAQPATP